MSEASGGGARQGTPTRRSRCSAAAQVLHIIGAYLEVKIEGVAGRHEVVVVDGLHEGLGKGSLQAVGMVKQPQAPNSIDSLPDTAEHDGCYWSSWTLALIFDFLSFFLSDCAFTT